MRHSIRVRLTVMFIGLAICPVLVVGGVLAWSSYSAQREQALHLQREVALRVSTEVEAFFAELENELRVVAKVQGLPQLDPARQNRILSELLSFQHAFQELILVDSQDRARAHASRSRLAAAREAHRAGAGEFTTPRASGQVYYGPLRVEGGSGAPLIPIAVPWLDPRTGRAEAVFLAEVRMKKIWDLIAD